MEDSDDVYFMRHYYGMIRENLSSSLSSMPSSTVFPKVRRCIQADHLLQAFMKLRRQRRQRKEKHEKHLKRLRWHLPPIPASDGELEDLSELSELSPLSGFSTGSESEAYWNGILGADWHASSVESVTTVCVGSHDSDDSVPALLPRGVRGSDSDSEDESSLSGMDADDEEESGEEQEGGHPRQRNFLRNWVQEQISAMYETCYEQPRTELPRGPAYIHHVLQALKAGHPDL
jgi:hypothetical protein